MADAKSSNSDFADERRGSLYRVTLLRKDINPRTATEKDFFQVTLIAPNSLSARLRARSEHPGSEAFEAVKIEAQP